MIPTVFVSSTVIDLHHLRDAVRETIEELGYVPVMNEYGDIGYLPSDNAENSCYRTVRDCQLAVLILGERYGSVGEDGRSVTHNEFLEAKRNNVPIITLVDKEVATYKRVYEAQEDSSEEVKFPGMDAPENSFQLLDEITSAETNNGILQYSSVADVRTHLKSQLAHIFGDLLRNRYDPVKTQVRDVLTEIKALRNELSEDHKGDPNYEIVARFLLDENHKPLRELLENTLGKVDAGIPYIVDADSFESFLEKAGIEVVERIDSKEGVKKYMPPNVVQNDQGGMAQNLHYVSTWQVQNGTFSNGGFGLFAVFSEKNRIVLSDAAEQYFHDLFTRIDAQKVK